MTSAPSVLHIFLVFLKLGCTSFGGPIAHLAFFNDEFIKRRQWLSQPTYTNLMSLCHFIPGPSSSQVGLGVGYLLRGWKGAVAAWLGFTLPSALLMLLFALGMLNYASFVSDRVIHYLKVVALVVVAQAIWQMSRTLLPSVLSRFLCALGALILIWLPGIATQLVLLSVMGLMGYWFLGPKNIESPGAAKNFNHQRVVVGAVIFCVSLVLLGAINTRIDTPWFSLFDSVYRSGALVFGGGHVVLPLLQQEVLSNSAISAEMFLAGYGLAQALPGPLFTFAAYIGALWMDESPYLGALVAIVGIFLPSFILVPALLPAWQSLQYHRIARSVLAGFQVGVIALLVSIFYQPLWLTTILSFEDAAIALAALCLMYCFKCPAWALVIAALIAGSIF